VEGLHPGLRLSQRTRGTLEGKLQASKNLYKTERLVGMVGGKDSPEEKGVYRWQCRDIPKVALRMDHIALAWSPQNCNR